MPALAPRSAVRSRPAAPDVATEMPPWIARASRTTATRSSPAPRRLLPGSRLGLVPMSLGMLLMLLVVVLGTLERENEKKLICDLVVAISSLCMLLLVRPRGEQEEADEFSRYPTQRGALSAIGGVSAGVCGPLAQSQQRTVEQASAEDKESPPAVDAPSGRTPIGVGRSGNEGSGAAGAGEKGWWCRGD